MTADIDSLYDLAKGSVHALVQEMEDLNEQFQIHPDTRLGLERYLTVVLVTGIQLFFIGSASLVLDYEEALSLLALLNENPGYWNRQLREALATYIDVLPTK